MLLDLDSSESPVNEEQRGERLQRLFWIGLLLSAVSIQQSGRLPGGKVVPGNVHSAEGWEELLLPEIERQQRMWKEVAFRAGVAFAKPEIYEALEGRGVKYAICIPANESLEQDIAELFAPVPWKGPV